MEFSERLRKSGKLVGRTDQEHLAGSGARIPTSDGRERDFSKEGSTLYLSWEDEETTVETRREVVPA